MKRHLVGILHPVDILGPKIGGIETFIKGFIKYAPDCFDIRFVGITSDPKSRPSGRWGRSTLGSKTFSNYPLFFERKENIKTKVPLTLRYTLSLLRSKVDFRGNVLLFNRIEPAVIFRSSSIRKIHVNHVDVVKQILERRSDLYWSKIPSLYRRFEKYVLPSFDKVFSVSEDALKYFQEQYPGHAALFASQRNLVDTDTFFPPQQPKRILKKEIAKLYPDISQEARWLVFAGRLQKVKEPLKLVDSFRMVTDDRSQVVMIVAGEGNLKSQLRRKIHDEGLEGKIFLVGSLSQSELSDFFRASDCLVLTSRSEGMPSTVLEALGCGLPVVSTEVGSIGEVVKSGFSGEISKDHTEEHIASSISKVLKNGDAYTAENCVRSIKRYLPREALGTLYESIYALSD